MIPKDWDIFNNILKQTAKVSKHIQLETQQGLLLPKEKKACRGQFVPLAGIKN